jgi:hypothetical protein
MLGKTLANWLSVRPNHLAIMAAFCIAAEAAPARAPLQGNFAGALKPA